MLVVGRSTSGSSGGSTWEDRVVGTVMWENWTRWTMSGSVWVGQRGKGRDRREMQKVESSGDGIDRRTGTDPWKAGEEVACGVQ